MGGVISLASSSFSSLMSVRAEDDISMGSPRMMRDKVSHQMKAVKGTITNMRTRTASLKEWAKPSWEYLPDTPSVRKVGKMSAITIRHANWVSKAGRIRADGRGPTLTRP